jgi:DNA topoisomerase-3
MGKSLIIAEKPSVAADIAKSLGGFTKEGDFYESDEFVLSSAVGHLVEIAAPEQFEVKRGKWSFAHLPVIPPHFDLRPIDKSADRLKLLTRLIKRKDVDALINACDAGREGELIFRLIAQHAKAKQPIRRLWLQSMTPAAIKDGFRKLREDDQMMPLADAARCRSEADWLVGINGTRAMTAFNSRDGGFFLTTVGRVQTPTLAIVVEREERIRKFKPRGYFEVKASFDAKAGQYEGRWFDPAFTRNPADADLRAERIWDEDKARQIVADCTGKQGIVTEEAKPSTQQAPALFDLTSLQREANGRFGFSAKTTLALAQALYERHKVLTYPRTDSKALPEDYVSTVRETLGMLENVPPHGQFSVQILNNDWVKPANKRVFDNTKISDHFAIIPTTQAPKALSEAEQKIYDLVVKRFLAVFFPAAEFRVTTRITTVEAHAFKTEGRVLVNPGFLAIYGREAIESKPAAGKDADDTPSAGNLVPVEPNEQVRTAQIDALSLATRPPARFNEATLLSAMEGAGKLVDDEELSKAMAAKGLGTPATRAQVIEGLINENYLIREGRDLIPTAKAFQLVTLLRGLGVAELTMPELTGEWEYKLSQMERGHLDRDAFMSEIAEMTRHIVERAKGYGTSDVPGDYATLTQPCPRCGQEVRENYRRFACTACDWSITKSPSSRLLEPAEAEELIANHTIGPVHGFRSKMGRPFSAILKLVEPDWKLEFDFGQDDSQDDEPVDFSLQTALGQCPRCASRVFEHGMSYVCEKSVGPGRTCEFRSGKVILQQPIEAAQMSKLLNEGRTDLLDAFVSSRTRRRFKAFLVRQPDGKVGFEFQAAAPRAGAKARPQSGKGSAETAADTPDESTGQQLGESATDAATATKSAAGKKTAARSTGGSASKTAAKPAVAKSPARSRKAS